MDFKRLNSRIGSGKKIDALLSNTNLNPNPKINVIAMTKEHQFFYGTDTRGKPKLAVLATTAFSVKGSLTCLRPNTIPGDFQLKHNP